MFDIEKAIHLESRQERPISNIDDLIYLPMQNRIITLAYDDQAGEVLVYDGLGKYLFSLEKHVKGQDEYGIAYEDSLLAFHSSLSQKVKFYSIFNGAFKKEYALNILKKPLSLHKFTLFNGEMYFYAGSDSGNRNEHYRVYKFKDMNFVKGYGKAEYNANLNLSQMTIFQGTIIYTGILDGNLDRIDPRTDQETLFCSFPEVAKTNQETPPFAVHRDFEGISSFFCLWPVANFLFVGKKERERLKFAIVGPNGDILQDHLPLSNEDIGTLAKNVVEKVYAPAKPPSQVIVRNIQLFPHERGLIQSSFFLAEEDLVSLQTPNPTLVIFQLKKLFKITPIDRM